MKTLLLLPVLAKFIASGSKNATTSDPVADFTIKPIWLPKVTGQLCSILTAGKTKLLTILVINLILIWMARLLLQFINCNIHRNLVLSLGQQPKDGVSVDDKLNQLTISITANGSFESQIT